MWFFFLIFFLANSHRCFSRKVGETRNDDHFLFSPTLREKDSLRKKNDKKPHPRAHSHAHNNETLIFNTRELKK